jgi:hypothetical protein
MTWLIVGCMNDSNIKIEYFKFWLEQTPELILLDSMDYGLNIVFSIHEVIFPAHGAGKSLSDKGGVYIRGQRVVLYYAGLKYDC